MITVAKPNDDYVRDKELYNVQCAHTHDTLEETLTNITLNTLKSLLKGYNNFHSLLEISTASHKVPN